MKKRTLKYFIIFLIITCFITSPISNVRAQSLTTPNVDELLNTSYDSVVNIQKQLAIILENYFISLVNQDVSKPSSSSLKVYLDQLDTLNKELSDYTDSKLEIWQRSNLEILLNGVSSLSYMANKIDLLLNSVDATAQYVLFRSISYIDTLILQTLSYFNRI